MVEGGRKITHGEILVWVGLWFIMANIQGFQQHVFWSNSAIYPFDRDPYHFNSILLWILFDEILKELAITDEPPPEYKDQFLEARQLIDV